MDFKSEHILENEHVLLRRLTKEDLPHLLPFSINEPEIWKYSVTPPAGEENLRSYIDDTLKGFENGTEYPFIVFDKRSGKYAGSTRFYDIQSANKNLHIGYTWYGKDFQGTGLNKQCKYLLLSFAFEKLGTERVEFRANNKNERSIAAMKSIGCTVEGILRKNILQSDQQYRDTIVLSILKEEWDNGVKAMLEKKAGLRK